MTDSQVAAVRTDRHGRVTVTFTPTGWELRPSPVTSADLTKWFWWSFGACLAFAWVGFVPHLAGAPKEVAFGFALPGALLLFGLLLYGVLALIGEVLAFVLALFGLTRSGQRHRLFAAPKPSPDVRPLVALPAGAVAEARATQHWRRVVITVRMVDGIEFRYSRFGMRHPRRALQEGFAALLGARLVATV
ncbi:hypothetical protein NLX83_34125 [Allokutzneria sp. A3M-2-11 16]|uniref:hypothetical protein n=1 Tax=Allokutzneria sp. A3M-2-11 16 TaxID=2962043 RepID=UPI0020B70D65|nr:hypothetical protein [Allokutzneria sp. A3M-2-11 16]MCP3804317.1 hypothetical protein [Allokutzneria sp. A3M-2-11 16]